MQLHKSCTVNRKHGVKQYLCVVYYDTIQKTAGTQQLLYFYAAINCQVLECITGVWHYAITLAQFHLLTKSSKFSISSVACHINNVLVIVSLAT